MTISGRGPTRSASRPASGAISTIISVEGRKRTPASTAEYPSEFCMYSARKKNIASIANETTKATRFAPRKVRERKYEKSTIGSRTRGSSSAKPPSPTTAADEQGDDLG